MAAELPRMAMVGERHIFPERQYYYLLQNSNETTDFYDIERCALHVMMWAVLGCSGWIASRPIA